MISEQRTLTFLWRCSSCPAVYDCETLALLLDDGTSKACSCGGTLVEGVGPVPEHTDLTAAVLQRRFAGLLRIV